MGDNDQSLLCCCEYFDLNNERNHILACCCNCVDLDEGFDSLIRGQGIRSSNKNRFFLTLNDRMRLPWCGGAKQVSFDAILPIIIISVMFIIAAQSLWWTIFAFTAVIVILISIFRFFITKIPQTKFFIVWTITSIVLLYVIFQVVVIPILRILLWENIILSLFIGASIWYLHQAKQKTYDLIKNEYQADFRMRANYKCSICQVNVPEKDHHCFWIDCCIGRHNQWCFILALLNGLIALLYSSNLILTSVCHPYEFFYRILLPDDCSEVYDLFQLSISFVSGIYALGVAALVLLLLAHQILLVSLGLSSREWRQLSILAKLSMGLLANRPNSLGFRCNWKRIIFTKQSYMPLSHQSQI